MSKNNAVIFGLEGEELKDVEKSFFAEINPVGYILFARNIQNPDQVKKLVSDLKSIKGQDCPILIDQEGGRVARLKPPYWRESPPMRIFAKIAECDIDKAEKAAYLNSKIIGQELIELGINVDCAPVCDLLFDGAHDIVGDRSFGSDVEVVSKLAKCSAQGFIDSGVLPVIKHIPGHGRALSDSHKELPVVNTSLEELKKTDFKVFENLSKMPWAMTAHILYNAIDNINPATLSSDVINLIRNDIGFNGLLISDDLSMEALEGEYSQRAEKSLKAGCDAVLHCNGKMEEMVAVANGVSEISDDAQVRFDKSMRIIQSNTIKNSNDKVAYQELIAG